MPMRLTINVECTPEEARAFLGLPDVTPINTMLVDKVAKRAETQIDMLDPAELLKTWMSFGGMMREQFLEVMSAAAAPVAADTSGSGATTKPKK